ncbi:hypothetical protein DFH27DRAFT_484461 [Peziza echinospora]|nr:hypothetical protein DFH27DRAFT_484461 [Peziza echinospora]
MAHSPSTSTLTSLPSNLTKYEPTQNDVQERLERYQATTAADNTKSILDAFSKYLPIDGRRNVCEDILQSTTDEDLKSLAKKLFTALLIPMKARGQTPIVTPSRGFAALRDAEDLSAETGPSTRSKQGLLKKACLLRDGTKCIITGVYDVDESLKIPPDEWGTRMLAKTEVAHIIPFYLGSFTERERPTSAIIWDTIYRCFPSVRSRVNLLPEKIDEPWNAATMMSSLHSAFAEFSLALEPTSREHIYRIVTYPHFPSYFNKSLVADRLVTLHNAAPQYPLPNGHFFAAHAAIAKILHITGVGDYMEKVMREREEIGCLAEDGSTNVAEFIEFTKGLMGTRLD